MQKVSHMKRFLFVSALLLGFAGILVAEERTWTSSDGKTIAAEIIALDGDSITLRMTGRGDMKFPLSRLSDTDQEFAREWQEKASTEKPADDKSPGDFADLKLGEWPKYAAAEFGIDEIQIVKEDKDEGKYVYRSPHFEFRSGLRLSKSVVKDFADIFEATFEFMKVIPIGLNPKPLGDGYYPTQLYKDKNDYMGGGGMEGSGGMHAYRFRGREIIDSIIKVPMTSLGVKYTGVRFVPNNQKNSDTLIHEIAHQMTGRWLPITPVWFKEGLAETVSTQKYSGGRFSLTNMDRAIREDLARRTVTEREFRMVNLERLMTMTSKVWSEDLAAEVGGRVNYPSANLLFYYFLKLEGEGNGETLVNYMRALSENKSEEEARNEFLMPGKSFAQLEEDVARGWRSEGLRLEFQ